MPDKLMIGHKLRRLRRDSGLSQAQLAEQLSISPSYLNLIEHNQRPVTAALLLRLGQNFGIDLQSFAADDETRLLASLREVLADALFQDADIGRQDLRELAEVAPPFAEAMIALYGAYRLARQELESQSDLPPDLARASPVDTARDFFEAELNHFAALEEAAEELWRAAPLEGDALLASLIRHVEAKHRLRVQFMPGDVMGSAIRRHDPHRGRILLSEMLPPPSRVFQLACAVALLEQHEAIDAILERFTGGEEARSLVRIGLVNYFAGAVLLPYQPFAEAARTTRHDLTVLAARFGASFEQVCHRLTTLQRAGSKGIPFFMIRIDSAGNVSKHFSANTLHFSRFGGACPIWAVYSAFQTPGQVLVQLAEMPDEQRYVSMACTVAKPWRPVLSRAPQFAIALGCEARHAGELAYADALSVGSAAADRVGITCRTCPRRNCAYRAFPASHQSVSRTDLIRSDPIFTNG